ncbi:hypothetical protein OPT61_g9440 [Boeremia exigua]|uniref:Uncharacterized protein n=1 Tax=Boeremia exigua TaxID=749465 RepID=A0ACC2HU20_9PLEO|nr:hypothetical protein OPT61_g9440 [Boeremia exigua]
MAQGRDFASLPLELQSMVFELLPMSALKNARLACKTWNAPAAKVLWRETSIDLFAPRPFKHFLAVRSGGMLDNVRELSVTTGPWDSCSNPAISQGFCVARPCAFIEELANLSSWSGSVRGLVHTYPNTFGQPSEPLAFTGQLYRISSSYCRQSVSASVASEEYMNDDDSEILTDFLIKTKGLTKIVESVRAASHLPAAESLCSHAKSLQELQWVGCKMVSICDLEYLIANCTSLKRVVVDFWGLKEYVDNLSMPRPFSLQTSEAHYKVLAALSRISTLKRLSLHVLMLGYGSEPLDGERQWRYAQVAEGAVDCLANHGSNIEFLDFGSKYGRLEESEVDENGHSWPDYSYRKGSIMADTEGRQRFVKHTAIPIPVPEDASTTVSEHDINSLQCVSMYRVNTNMIRTIRALAILQVANRNIHLSASTILLTTSHTLRQLLVNLQHSLLLPSAHTRLAAAALIVLADLEARLALKLAIEVVAQDRHLPPLHNLNPKIQHCLSATTGNERRLTAASRVLRLQPGVGRLFSWQHAAVRCSDRRPYEFTSRLERRTVGPWPATMQASNSASSHAFTIQCLCKRLPVQASRVPLQPDNVRKAAETLEPSSNTTTPSPVCLPPSLRSRDQAFAAFGDNTQTLMCSLQRTTATRFDLPERRRLKWTR